LANTIAIAIVACGAEHDQIAAPPHLGMGNVATVILVKSDGLKAEGLM
jgi:hypothetical protein